MKKGFTLIELLAVIVILAIIALIATPIVLNIINDTKESAILRSTDFYIDALENEIMLENMKQGGNFNPNICTIVNKEISCDGKEINLKVDGEVPTSGTITFEEGKVKDVNLTYTNGTVTLNNKGELVLGESQKQLAPGLYDENDNLLASWEELVTKYDFKNKVENGGYNNDEMTGEAAFVIKENYPEAIKLVIDDSVTTIGRTAFENWSITSIIIPESVTSIGDHAFSSCIGLKEITIPNSVTSIGEYAFYGCSGLTTITISSSVTSIGNGAFSYCTSITSITIPNSVTSIGNSAFNNCTSLTTIYYKGTAEGSPWGAPNAKVETNF